MANHAPSVKGQIRTATARLLNEKNYLDITVTDIVRTAGIARVSFYRNYASIADVLDDMAEEIYAELETEIIPVLENNDERSWRELLFNMFYRFPKHHSIAPDKSPDNVNELFARLGAKLQQAERNRSPQTLEEKYLPFGKIGLIVNIIKKWMADGKRETPEEMVDFIMTFILRF